MQDEAREYVVRVSYLEIYNETLRDLLVDGSDSLLPAPKIHEDKHGRIFVRPLVATPCRDPEAVLELLAQGETGRRVAATEWNAHSSRSHVVFSLTIESRPVTATENVGVPVTPAAMRRMSGVGRDVPSPEADLETPTAVFGNGSANMPMTPSVSKLKGSTGGSDSGTIRISQLVRPPLYLANNASADPQTQNLIDLAGSEKLSADEDRKKESGYIKKSLLALQNVITSLSSSSSPTTARHIPYRNSQLTRLLQTSLSGNAKVAFLCTISPDAACEIDTLSTLRFAQGAKKIVTKAEVGQVVDRASLMHALEQRVLELEAALMTNADLTEALERERDEANERADTASKTRDEVRCSIVRGPRTADEGVQYELRLAELQNNRTPLKEQHDHLRRLIVTGSPRSPYGAGGAGSPRPSRAMGGTPYRPSRLSNVQEAAMTPSRAKSWRSMLFGGADEEARLDSWA